MEPRPTDDRRRFDALFREHSRPLLGYAMRRVAQPADAADVVAEAWMVAWRRIGDVPPGAEARPWLYGVARRVLANQRRGQYRRHRLAEALRAKLSCDLVAVGDHYPGEGTASVATALAALDDVDREVLQLTAWEGLSPSELAVALDIPAATARTRLHRARKRLRAQLEPTVPPDERTDSTGHDHGDERPLVQEEEKRA